MVIKIFACITALLITSACSHISKNSNQLPNLVSADALQRTFLVKVGNSTATIFAIDVDGKQYLVTAAHVLQNYSEEIEIQSGDQWIKIKAKIIGIAKPPIDIAVLSTDATLVSGLLLDANSNGTIVSEEYFFLGFPYGVGTADLTPEFRGYPLPIVKRATCAGFIYGENKKLVGFYFDGINNPGFSGGPVIDTRSRPLRVIGVISGFESTLEPIYTPTDEKANLYYKYNTGLVRVFMIDYAIDLIRANPEG